MSKDPAFLFYSRDFYEGTRNLTPEERACYIDLMIYQHQNKIIPLELKRVYMYCSGITADVVDYILTEKFVKTDLGYTNSRLNEVILNRENHSLKQSINGKIGQFYKQAKKLCSEMEYYNLKTELGRYNNETALSIVYDFYKLDYKLSLNLDEAMLKALLKHLAIAININIYILDKIENLEILAISDTKWLDDVCEYNKLNRKNIALGVSQFVKHLKANGEEKKTLKDFKSHFKNWSRILKEKAL